MIHAFDVPSSTNIGGQTAGGSVDTGGYSTGTKVLIFAPVALFMVGVMIATAGV